LKFQFFCPKRTATFFLSIDYQSTSVETVLTKIKISSKRWL